MREVTLPSWVPSLTRYVMAGLVVAPGIGKFLTYHHSVAAFTTWGIPAPATLVLVVGAIEVGAAALLFLDKFRQAAAIALIPVMAVAFWVAGEWQAVAVILSAVLLLVIDAGLLTVDAPANAD